MTCFLLSYTQQGHALAARVAALLRDQGYRCRIFAQEKFRAPGEELLSGSVKDWAGQAFAQADALVFCCASGIAVRAIAPHVRSKVSDPAVLVLDEGGRFVIPLLSGHLGGANELAISLSNALGAVPVLTTATDVNGLFAVDVFAKRNHLFIESMELAKAVSAALLEGQPVGFLSDLPQEGTLPKGLTEGPAKLGILVSARKDAPFPRTLRLIPQRYAAGLGCRKDKDFTSLLAFFRENLQAAGVDKRELFALASVDLKAQEPGLVALAKACSLPFFTYAPQELMALEGDFSASPFVLRTTGVDSVCERAAVRASGGNLIIKKQARDGMTFALAKREEAIRFE